MGGFARGWSEGVKSLTVEDKMVKESSSGTSVGTEGRKNIGYRLGSYLGQSK